jgi:hypothetical protein
MPRHLPCPATDSDGTAVPGAHRASDREVGRRAVLRGVGSLVVVGAGLRLDSASAAMPVMPARTAESLADSFGVVIHLNDQTSIYGNEQAIVSRVLALGARHARNRMTVHVEGVRNGFRALSAGGCRINATCQTFNLRSQPSNRELMNEAINFYGGDAIRTFSSFEGVNEPNNNGIPWVAETRARTIDLWNQAKSRSQTAHIPIVGPSLANTWTSRQDYLALGDLSQHVDRGSIHMYPRGTKPSTLIDQQTRYSRAAFGNHRTFCTEGGYNNALNQQRLRPVPEKVAGVYGPRHLLEHFIRGNMFFRYELMDHIDPQNKVFESNWGLIRVRGKDPSSWSVKPAYTAMRNFLHLIGDRGPQFTPHGLALKITGGGGDLRHALVQKRNGDHYLCLWRDVAIYDPARRAYTQVAPHSISVTLAKSKPVRLYRPDASANPVATFGLTRSFHVPLAGSVFVAQIG